MLGKESQSIHPQDPMTESDSQAKQTRIHTTFLKSDEIRKNDPGERLKPSSAETLYGPASDEHIHVTRATANATSERKETYGQQDGWPPTECLSEATAHWEEGSRRKCVCRANPDKVRRLEVVGDGRERCGDRGQLERREKKANTHRGEDEPKFEVLLGQSLWGHLEGRGWSRLAVLRVGIVQGHRVLSKRMDSTSETHVLNCMPWPDASRFGSVDWRTLEYRANPRSLSNIPHRRSNFVICLLFARDGRITSMNLPTCHKQDDNGD